MYLMLKRIFLNKRGKILISSILTITVISLLLFSGVAKAVEISISTDKDSYLPTEPITFNVEITINSNERIPIDDLKLTISDDNLPFSKECVFAVNGEKLDGCNYLTITQLDSDYSYTSGGLFGYGYGYNSNEDYGYQGTNFGYGYGYGYGYNNGITGTLKYQIVWDIASENIANGNFKSSLEINSIGEEDSFRYSKDSNNFVVKQDSDNDNIADNEDNCVDIPNENQDDVDADAVGNMCDNCPNLPNPGQEDSDGNGVGDACQIEDIDGDGIEDTIDNCVNIPNPEQEDNDADTIGNVCDNCVDVPNENQEDSDGDGKGDACDIEDIDNDGVADENDNCVNTPNANQEDSDADAVGNMCDNCPNLPNPNQEDSNANGIGDACDGVGMDSDNDTVINENDNCPTIPNENQEDIDADSKGDVCDNCGDVWNPDQDDNNANGIGNACDNTAPIITSGAPNGNANEDSLYQYQLTATDADSDLLSYTDDSNLFDISTSGLIKFTPKQAQAGSYTINIYVSDGRGGQDSLEFNLNVNNVNDAPVLTPAVLKAMENEVLNYQFIASDEENDNLVFTSNENLDFVNIVSDQLNINPDSSDAGNYSFFVTVNDGHGGTDTELFKLIVSDVNQAPYIQDESPATAVNMREDQTTIFSISGCDNDHDPISVKWYLDNELKATNLFPSTSCYSNGWSFVGKFSDEESNAGIYDVKVIVSDGLQEAEHSWNLNVERTPDSDDDGIPNYIDNCVFIENNNQADSNSNGAGDACEGDLDGDSVDDADDFIAGDKSFIDTKLAIDVTVNNNNNLNQEITGEKIVEFNENVVENGSVVEKPIIKFNFNFGEDIGGEKQTIDFSNIAIEKQEQASDVGVVIIKGIDLTAQNKTKTVYLDNIGNKGSVCIKDAEIASIKEFSNNCDGANEHLIKCDNILKDGYTCTAEEGKYKATGLKHSAVRESVQCYVNADCSDNVYCNGAEVCNAGACEAGIVPTADDGIACTADSCDEANDQILHTTQNNLCDDNLYCNGVETCSAVSGCVAGASINCAANNILGINSCNNNPDNNVFTLDARNEFISSCNENVDACTTGSTVITYTPSVASCNAECDATHSCAATNCGVDTCVGTSYYDYTDVANACNNGDCTSNACNQPVISTFDSRCYTPPPTPSQTIACYSSSGCGIDIWTGAKECKEGDVYQNKVIYTCYNPGTASSYCSYNAVNTKFDDCGDSPCENGACEKQCETNADCDDGKFCNGVEICNANWKCEDGADPIVNDNVACTIDSCDEVNDKVVHNTNNNLCEASDCDYKDKCVNGDYYNYEDAANTCSLTECTANTCGSPIVTYNDAENCGAVADICEDKNAALEYCKLDCPNPNYCIIKDWGVQCGPGDPVRDGSMWKKYMIKYTQYDTGCGSWSSSPGKTMIYPTAKCSDWFVGNDWCTKDGVSNQCGNNKIAGAEQCDNGNLNIDNPSKPGYAQTLNYCTKKCESKTIKGDYCGDNICQEANENYNNCNVDCKRTAITGDFNNDYCVGLGDLVLLGNNWDKKRGQSGWNAVFDLNNDGIIGLGDLVLFGNHWNEGCPLYKRTSMPDISGYVIKEPEPVVEEPVEEPVVVEPVYTYSWYTNNWNPVSCPVTCGGGTQTRTIDCKRSNGVSVDSSNCNAASKPATTQSCNTQACVVQPVYTYSWYSGAWGECINGKQTRSVSCKRNDNVHMSYYYCAGAEKPDTSKDCAVEKPVVQKPVCTNQCDYKGQEEGSSANPSMHFMICGDYNKDGCLEWDNFGDHYCGWSNYKKLYCISPEYGTALCR